MDSSLTQSYCLHRAQIHDLDIERWQWLAQWPNRFDINRDTITWYIPLGELTWWLLKGNNK